MRINFPEYQIIKNPCTPLATVIHSFKTEGEANNYLNINRYKAPLYIIRFNPNLSNHEKDIVQIFNILQEI
jgi:hypothetical protein